MNDVNEIKSRISISSVISKKLKLTKKGKYLIGLCPFHNERTPSFAVDDLRGIYHCFGCGAHGDAFQFITATENISFKEALKRLAEAAGVHITSKTEQEKQVCDIVHVLHLANNWFKDQLKTNLVADDYLKNRNIPEEIRLKFELGYAPNVGLVDYLLSKGIILQEITSSGLIRKTNYRSNYDYFHNRIMFPIYNASGKIIAFGGRSIDSSTQPKYLNSPETPFFHKRNTLYSINFAMKAAIKEKKIIVVEGYTDVLALNQLNIGHVVSTLGTSVTLEHIRILWKLAPEIIICMDGDNAGKIAAKKIAKLILPILCPEANIKFASLPEDKDPYDLCNEQPHRLKEILHNSKGHSEFLWDHEVSRITNPLLMIPEQYAILENNLMNYIKCINHSSVAKYYKSFFHDKIYSLRQDVFKNKSNNFRKSNKIGGMLVKKFNHISLSSLEREENDLKAFCVILNFPSLLDDPIVFEQFSHFNVQREDLYQLQQHIVNLKTMLGSELTRNMLVTELEKNNLRKVLKFCQDSSVAVGCINDQSLAMVIWKKIMLFNQAKDLEEEIIQLRVNGDFNLAEKLNMHLELLNQELRVLTT